MRIYTAERGLVGSFELNEISREVRFDEISRGESDPLQLQLRK